VTVNYDPLLERGLDGEQLEPIIIYSAAVCRHLVEDAVFVIKVHGCPYEDPNAENLVMLPNELQQPPDWVRNFLNNRVQERIFLYVGFSGNASYVTDCVSTTTRTLEGNVHDAFAVDIVPANEIFESAHPLRHFFELTRVPPVNYSPVGSDDLFIEVANIVFRRLMLSELEAAAQLATRHGCENHNWLHDIVSHMNYEQLRGFVRKLSFFSEENPLRVRQVGVKKAFKWMLLLTCNGILDHRTFRPVLAAPYHPGPEGSASAPIVIFDGRDQEASDCLAEISKASKGEKFKRTFQVGGLARWYAIVVNCDGTLQDQGTSIIQREEDSVAREYSPVFVVDENTLVNRIDHLQELFAS